MKSNLLNLVIILDRSGSMEIIRADMIGGFNSFIKEQKKTPTDCKVSFYQFDTGTPKVETIYEGKPLKDVPDLSTETFVPRGGTPLYDAVAHVVRAVGERLKNTAEDERPEKILVVCITDGEENSSTEWNNEQVKQMIEHQQNKYKWEFVYLGANQDAWVVGGNLGFKASSSLGYVASKGGTKAMFASLSSKVATYRCCASAGDSIGFDDADKKAQEDEGLKP